MAAAIDEGVLGGRAAVSLAQGSGDPLLLLHGIVVGTADSYRPVMDSLQDRWACRALWFRGHGRSAWADSYRIEDYGRDVIEFLEAGPHGPSVLVGHSLGSMVALYVAAVRPDLVRAIFLEDTPYFGVLTVERHRTEVTFAFFEWFRKARLEMNEAGHDIAWLAGELRDVEAGRPGSTATYGDVAPEPVIAAMAATLALTDPDVVVSALESFLLDRLTIDMLASIRCPAALLVGNHERGGAIRPEDLPRWRSAMPHLEIAVVDEANHFVHASPRTLPRYQAELDAFLRRV